MITRQQYMGNASELHFDFYKQFVTEATIHFVKDSIKMERLRLSKDPHLNDLGIRHSASGWLWDASPMNVSLYKELACGQGSLPSQASHTCVGKAAARMLLEKEGCTLWQTN